MTKDDDLQGNKAAESEETLEVMRGFGAHVGYRLTAWRDGFAEVTLDLNETHTNRSGLVHGGLLSTLIDVAGGYAGTYSADSPRMAVTLSMNVHFVGRAQGNQLVATGRVRTEGKTIYFSSVEIRDDQSHLVATGEGVYKYRRSS